MTYLFKKIVEFLWKKYGAKGDRFGLMFKIADYIAFRTSKDEEKKITACTNRKRLDLSAA